MDMVICQWAIGCCHILHNLCMDGFNQHGKDVPFGDTTVLSWLQNNQSITSFFIWFTKALYTHPLVRILGFVMDEKLDPRNLEEFPAVQNFLNSNIDDKDLDNFLSSVSEIGKFLN